MITLKTSKGDIVIETYADKAPITVKNFESYVDSGFFNGTIFHRVIDCFISGVRDERQPRHRHELRSSSAREQRSSERSGVGSRARRRLRRV